MDVVVGSFSRGGACRGEGYDAAAAALVTGGTQSGMVYLGCGGCEGEEGGLEQRLLDDGLHGWSIDGLTR